jgi:hypothetical protein
VKVRVCGLKDLKCSQDGHLPWWWAPPVTIFITGEFAPAIVSIEAAFIGMAEAPDTPIRPSPSAPTVARMRRMALSSFDDSIHPLENASFLATV